MTGFIDAMRNAGISPPESITTDGTIHRFDIDGDKRNSKNGWYILFDDPPAGSFGCWKRNIAETWRCNEGRSYTPEEQTRYRANMEAAKRQREEERAKTHAECRKESKRIWEQADNATGSHEYLKAKAVKPYGLKIHKGALVVPLRDSSGTFHGLQFISTDGQKRYKTGTSKQGHYHSFGVKPQTVLYLAEGYATAATIHEATGAPVAVCFDCGNLKPVAEVLRGKFLELKIVICGDDDSQTEGNPGKTKAAEAAKAINGLLALPSFSDGANGTDFNDLAKVAGLEEVRRQVEAATPSQEKIENKLGQWEEPLLFGKITPPSIPANILPCWLGEYVEAVSSNTQTPPGMAVMIALSVIATCLQKRLVISPRGDDYKEPLNLWTATALPPASRKTAVISALTEPLCLWEKEQSEQMADSILRTKIKRDTNLRRIDRLTKEAAKEDDPAKREVLIYEIAETEKDTPEELRPPRLWTSDVTPERLQMMLAEHGERMALLSDEGGIFEIMGGLYSDGRANLDVFLQAHAGKGVRVDRASREAYLDAPSLTFGLAIQPSVIADFSQGNKKRFRGNGSLARFLYCLPQNNIGSRNVRKHTPIPESVKAKYHTKINDLLDITPCVDDSDKERPRELHLTPDALDSWLTFSQYIEDKQGPNRELENIQDWTGKLPGAALRIAGIFHVVEHGVSTLSVNKMTMENALDLADLLIEHAKAAFDLMGAEQTTDDAKAVFRWIVDQKQCKFTRHNCHKKLQGRFKKIERLKPALDDLQSRAIISNPTKEQTGGRPSIAYHVNPAIFTEGGN